MRNISANGLATLAKQYGNEPVTIIEVDWAEGRALSSYADRDVGQIPGKIVAMGELDNVVDMTTNLRSQQLDITLDDTDGSIKGVFDGNDIHGRPVRAYQWFTGLDLSDKFLVFSGRINTPISWNERDRTVKITVVTYIEDREIGFSAEEGDFPYIPTDLIGKPWPMVFGQVADYPALPINFAIEGVTLDPVGIITDGYDPKTGKPNYLSIPLYENGTDIDQQLQINIALKAANRQAYLNAAQCWQGTGPVGDVKAHVYLEQANKLSQQIAWDLATSQALGGCVQAQRKRQWDLANDYGLGDNPIRILGGEDFPQNTTVTVNINGGYFTGHFAGQLFYIESRENPQADLQAQEEWIQLQQSCLNVKPPRMQSYNFEIPVPCGSLCDTLSQTLAKGPANVQTPSQTPWSDLESQLIAGIQALQSQGYTDITTTVNNMPFPASFAPATSSAKCVERQAGALILGLEDAQSLKTVANIKQFWADAGARVVLNTVLNLTHVASITPGQVLAVKAFQTLGGTRRLTLVPPDYYTVNTQSYGTVTAVQVVLKQPLSYLIDAFGRSQGWDDTLYITFQSTIGPNVVDILTYIIDNYTSFTCDAASFDYVRTKLQPFPANFPLLDRRNTLEVLKEIAFQARCGIWIDNGVVYLKYLPEEPTPVAEITASDIDAEHGVEIELTETERLVTKMKVHWKLGWAPEPALRAEQTMVLRHNVQRYGLYEQDFNWYIFNQPDVLLKMATFWLVRYSQAWKRVKFRTFLNKLNVETFDCINFNVPGCVAKGPVKMLVQKATYNSTDNCIDFECEAPVKAGAMEACPFYWPSNLTLDHRWPPADDIESGDAGGGGIGGGAGGTLPIGFTETIGSGGTVFVGGTNVVFGPHADWGDRTPSDVGFEAQPVATPDDYGTPNARPQPVLDFSVRYLKDSPPWVPDSPAPDLTIDLATTKVVDSQGVNPTQYGYLRSLVAVGSNQDVVLNLDRAKMQLQDAGDPGLVSDVLRVVGAHGAIQGSVAIVTPDQPNGAPFDFRYDADGAKFGAGTAFLKAGPSGP